MTLDRGEEVRKEEIKAELRKEGKTASFRLLGSRSATPETEGKVGEAREEKEETGRRQGEREEEVGVRRAPLKREGAGVWMGGG